MAVFQLNTYLTNEEIARRLDIRPGYKDSGGIFTAAAFSDNHGRLVGSRINKEKFVLHSQNPTILEKARKFAREVKENKPN